MSSDETAPAAEPGKRARTREKLLDIAAELFRTRGIAAVSLDEIARQAGLTKGAIYGNFASKDELVFAVAMERADRGFISFDDSAPVRIQLRQMARRIFRDAPRERRDLAFFAELDLYTLARADLSGRFLEAAIARHRRSAELIDRFRDELRVPPRQFVVAVQGLIGGLLFQHACHPEQVTEEVALIALEALLQPEAWPPLAPLPTQA